MLEEGCSFGKLQTIGFATTMITAHEGFIRELTLVQPMLRRYLIAAVIDYNVMEEILQETNLALWSKAEDYNPDLPFEPWAIQFARMQVMAHRKRATRSRIVRLDEEVLEKLAIEAPDVLWNENEKMAILDDCMSELTDRSRDLLKQRYTECKTVRSISQESGCTEGSLQQAFFKIRSQLRQCIEKRSRTGVVE